MRLRDEIERRWLERLSTSVRRPELTPSELRDSMPEYLLRLAEGLSQEDSAQAGGTLSWRGVARDHAETRVRLGFDIDEVVGDFILLRQVIVDVLREQGVLDDVRQALKLADLIEGAIQAAVTSYVESRDCELRRQHAEHIGFIAHELRGPLSTAMLATAHLHRTLSLPPREARTLGVVERSHARLNELIDGVLRVERDAHELTPKPVSVSLRELLDEPIATAALAANAKGVALDVRVEPDVVVEVDPTLTLSAVENVVQNAIKYTDHGEVRLVVEEAPRAAIVHVYDNCPGISQEELETIFEPFRRGQSQSEKPGSGLGLAIARRALEAQGGRLGAESGEGKGGEGEGRGGTGCHFWLILPKPQPH